MSTIKQIAERLHDRNPEGISIRSKREFREFVAETFEAMAEEIVSGAATGDRSLTISGLGTFSTKHDEPRKGRNPQTMEEIMIAAKERAKFVASKRLKDRLQSVAQLASAG